MKFVLQDLDLVHKMTSRWSKKRIVDLEVQKYMKIIAESSASVSSSGDPVCVDEVDATKENDVHGYAYICDDDNASCFYGDAAQNSLKSGDMHGHSDDFDTWDSYKADENVQEDLLCSYAAANADDDCAFYIYSTSEFERQIQTFH